MEFCQGNALNLRALVEGEHHDCRDQKQNENAPDPALDMAKKFPPARGADFPLSLDPNPFIF